MGWRGKWGGKIKRKVTMTNLTRLYDRTAISTRIAVAKKARQDGLIRDLAIERLIGKGVLSKDFVDAAP